MLLPETVLTCMRLLGQAGFPAYAVGGCVRDALAGLTPHDYDLCTAATPEQMHRVFAGYPLVTDGEKHGTVGVIFGKQVVEITTFRTDGAYADNRHPDSVRFVEDLKEDLARRDFTVNAMAYSPETGYIDPFGGEDDRKKGILRTVGDPCQRFSEDALRILRGVRFAVRFRLTPEKETEKAMFSMTHLLDHLARERVFDELCKLLPWVTAADLIRYAPVLCRVLPELAPSVGFRQNSPHHAYDVYTHTAYVTERVPGELPLRWAALLHDAGKPACYSQDETGRGHFYGHSEESARLADQALRRLKAPTALREQTVFLIAHHMTPPGQDRKALRRQLGKYGVRPMEALLALQRADRQSKGVTEPDPYDFDAVEALIRQILREGDCLSLKDLAVNGDDLLCRGIAPGKTVGEALSYLLEQVQEGTIPNEKEILLNTASQRWGE